MSAKSQHPHWDEYILWLATPEQDRGEIATEEEWARSKGYADSRTMRRWKGKPEFLERQRRLTEGLAAKSGMALLVDGEDDDLEMDGEERDYRLVKSKLVESAKSGNLKAQEQYMKLYGKSWIDEEQSARSADFSNLELPDLVAKAATALAPEILAEALRAAGWTVLSPEEVPA
jgi:hypothetical protein